MEALKHYFVWLFGTAFAVMFFAAISWVLRPVDKMVDRQVQVNSHQYIEGVEQRAAILRANMAEIDAMISQNPERADELRGQKRALQAQLRAITINN